MPPVALNDFAGRAGESYAVPADGTDHLLVLDIVQELPDHGREGGSFRLEFVGPAQPILPQAIYRFSGKAGDFEIFVVPVASGPEGTRYEAVFN